MMVTPSCASPFWSSTVMITGFSLVGLVPSGRSITMLLLSPIYTSQFGMVTLNLSVMLTT